MARKKPSYCHFPIQNLKVKLPYIRIYIKIKLYPNYSITPLAPSQWYQCVSGVLFMGEKSIIIFYSLLYLMFICGLMLQHLKTNVKNGLMVSTEWAKQGKKINFLFFSLVTNMKISSNCSVSL